MVKQSSYTRTKERLEEIVAQTRSKDVPLEKSLDLYEEALRLGSACAEMIDHTDFSTEELENATNYQGLDSMDQLSADHSGDVESEVVTEVDDFDVEVKGGDGEEGGAKETSAVEAEDDEADMIEDLDEHDDLVLDNTEFDEEEILDEDYLFEGFGESEDAY